MTPWHEDWQAIARRIEGTIRAGELYLNTGRGEDPYGTLQRFLLPQTERVFVEIQRFGNAYTSDLPKPAIACISVFAETAAKHFEKPNASVRGLLVSIFQLRLTALASLSTELEFHLSGRMEQLRTTTERAFIHLQQLIVADVDCRAKWKAAFNQREEVCETLGAVHLLWHGIWAFKAHGSGARTDLVLGTNIDNPSEIRRSALGLVHTEWKLARSTADVEDAAHIAREQARLYGQSALGGIELAAPVYLIVVSEKRERVPESDAAFRHINIAIDPDTPSHAARRADAGRR